MNLRILVRGGGDLASGVIARIHRAGCKVLVTELAHPLSVRRSVSFSQAIYSGEVAIEGIVGQRIARILDVSSVHENGRVAVIVDSTAECHNEYKPDVIVDGRMLKRPPDFEIGNTRLVIGLGPGFIAGVNCHAVVETKRGHKLGRVIWSGTTEPDTGLPEAIEYIQSERVIRAPCDGRINPQKEIGEIVEKGEVIAVIGPYMITAPFRGILRGLIHHEVLVTKGMKIGDLDPRCEPDTCSLISDKALAIGGGVLEAILSSRIWSASCCE